MPDIARIPYPSLLSLLNGKSLSLSSKNSSVLGQDSSLIFRFLPMSVQWQLPVNKWESFFLSCQGWNFLFAFLSIPFGRPVFPFEGADFPFLRGS